MPQLHFPPSTGRAASVLLAALLLLPAGSAQAQAPMPHPIPSGQTPPVVHFRLPTGFIFTRLHYRPVPVPVQRQMLLMRRNSPPWHSNDNPAPASTLEQLIEQANGSEQPYQFSYGPSTGALLDKGTFPDLSVFDYNQSSLLAGALVRGDANFIDAGQLVHLPLVPSGGTLYMTGITVKPDAMNTLHVTQATEPALDAAVTKLANQAFDPNQNTQWECEKHAVSSSADASVQANVSFGYMTYAKFNNLFNSADSSTQNHVLVNCSLQLFALNYVPDTTPTSVANAVYFDPATTVAAAQPFLGVGRPPLVVSSVTYGAEFFLMADSTASSKDMEDALTAAFSYAGFSGGLGLTDKQKTTLANSDIHVLAMGGRASAAADTSPVFTGTNAADALVAWLKGNIDVAGSGNVAQETGVPINYLLNYLDSTPVAETATVLGIAKATTDAKLVKATLWFQQNGNGKGKDTIVDIDLEDGNNRQVAGYRIGDGNSFTNNSQSPVYTLQSLANATETSMADGYFHMLIHPADHDVWKIHGLSDAAIRRRYRRPW